MDDEVAERPRLAKEASSIKQDQIKSKSTTIDELVSYLRRKQEQEVRDRKTNYHKQSSVAVSFMGSVTSDQITRPHLPSLQRNVYLFFHRPHSWFAYGYHLLVFVIVFACVFVTVLQTINKFEKPFLPVTLEMEKVIVVWFTGEFVIRLWASGCWVRYQGFKGKLLYLSSGAHLCDLIVIIVSIGVLFSYAREGNFVFAASAFRGFHRFFQVIRMIRAERRFTPFRVLLSVLYSQREQLIVITYIAFLFLSSAAFLLYLAEKDTNEQFESIADSFWWAVVSLFTIGYGDKVPITWLGKLLASFFIMLGVSIFTIPAGILGAGLAINVKQQQKDILNKKKQIPAARLIQSCWRFYCSDPNNYSTVTWDQYQVYGCLGRTERNAIKFIRILRLLSAVKSFRLVAEKDLHYLIEQTRTDHLTISYKINELQNGLKEVNSKLEENANKICDQITRLEELSRQLGDKCDKLNRLQGEQHGESADSENNNANWDECHSF